LPMVVLELVKHLSHSIMLFKDVLDERTPYERIYLVRSLVATREIGFFLELMKIRQIFTRFLIRIW
jgi:hypothetical protein